MKSFIIFLVIVFSLTGCMQTKFVDIQTSAEKQNYTKNETVITEKKEHKVSDKNLVLKDKVNVLDEIKIMETPITNQSDVLKVAFIFSSNVVGNYVKSSVDTMLGYLEYRGENYDIRMYDTVNEDYDSINSKIEELKSHGFSKVIALFSPNATDVINRLNSFGLTIYLPIINKYELDFEYFNTNYIYGGISYSNQIFKLLGYSNKNNVIFSQDTYLNNKLKKEYNSLVYTIKAEKNILAEENDFEELINDENLHDSTIFLNTNLIKGSLILSQITAHEIEPKYILATQNHYNPKLLTLTQVSDRKNLIIANSIGNINKELEDNISFYGGNIKYNWVDYSVLVGINYLYDKNKKKLVSNYIDDNQVQYNIKLFRGRSYGFLEIK